MPAPNGLGLYGVGFDSKGKWRQSEGGEKCKCYKVWRSMLMRCYQKNHHEREAGHTYSDAFVNPAWHDYQIFAEWWHKNYIDSWEIDKDILITGNREYGPATCVMVPREINSLFKCNFTGKEAGIPKGVNRVGSKFSTGYYNYHKRIHTTITSPTMEEAIDVYNFIRGRSAFLLVQLFCESLDNRLVTKLKSLYSNIL